METTAMQLYVNKVIIVPISVYNPPGKIEADSDLLIETGKKMILAGDFDAKHITFISRNNNAARQVLLNHYGKNNYIITAPISPTHIPDGTHSTPDVIDFAFLSNITSHQPIKTLGFLSLTDFKYLGYRISEYKSDLEDKLQKHNKINGAIRRHFGKQMNK